MDTDVTSKYETINGDDGSMHGDIPSGRKEMFSPLALDFSGNEAKSTPRSSPTLSPVFLSSGSTTNKLIASGKIKDCFILLQKTAVQEGCFDTLVEAGECGKFSRLIRETTPTSVMEDEDEALGTGGGSLDRGDESDYSHGSDTPDTRLEFDSHCLKANRNLFTSLMRDFPGAKMNSNSSSMDVEGSEAASLLEDDALFECEDEIFQSSSTNAGISAVKTSRLHRERHLSDDLMSLSSTGSSETIEYPIGPEVDEQEMSNTFQGNDCSSDKVGFEQESSLEFQDEPPRLERLESLPESSRCLDNPPVLSPLVLTNANSDNHQRDVHFFGASPSDENTEKSKPSMESETNKFHEQKPEGSSNLDPSGPTRSKHANVKNKEAFLSIPPVNNKHLERHCLIPHYLLNSVDTDQSEQRHDNTTDEQGLSSLTTDTARKSADTTIDSACSPQMENRPYEEAENREPVTPTKTSPRASAPQPQIVAVMSLRNAHSTVGQELHETRQEPVDFSQSVPKVSIVPKFPSVEQTSTDASFRFGTGIVGHNNPASADNDVLARTQSPNSALRYVNSDLEMEKAVASISEIQPQADGETDENPKYVFEGNIEFNEVVIDQGAEGSSSPACTIGTMYSMDEVDSESQTEEMQRRRESEKESDQVEAGEAQCSQMQDIQNQPTDAKPAADIDLEESMQQSLATLDSRQTVKENGEQSTMSKVPVSLSTPLESARRIKGHTDRNGDKGNDIPVPNLVPNEPHRPELPMQTERVDSSSVFLHHNTDASRSSPIGGRLQTTNVPFNTLGDNDSASKSRDGVREILDSYEAMNRIAINNITGPERSAGVFDKPSNESCANANLCKASSDDVVLPSKSQEMDTAISLALMAEMAPQNQAGNQTVRTSVQSTTALVSQVNIISDDVRVRHQSASGKPSAVPQDADADSSVHRSHSSNYAHVSENQNGASAPETLAHNVQTATKANKGRTRSRSSSGFAVVDYSDRAPLSDGQFDELKWRLLTGNGIQSDHVKQANAPRQVLPQLHQQIRPMRDDPTKEQNNKQPRNRRDIVSFGVGIPIECSGKRLVAYNTEILRPPVNVPINQANAGQIVTRNPSPKFLTRDNNSALGNAPPPTHFAPKNIQHYQTNVLANNQHIPQPHGGVTSTSTSKVYQQQHPHIIPIQNVLGTQVQKSPTHLRQQGAYPSNISWTSQPSSTPCTYPGNVAAMTQTTQRYKASNIPRREINSTFTHPNNVGTIYNNANQPVTVISGRQASSANTIASNYPTQTYQAQQQLFALSRNSATAPGHFLPNKGGTLVHATPVVGYQHTVTSQTTDLRNVAPSVSVAAVYNGPVNAAISNGSLESPVTSRTEQIAKQVVPLNRHEKGLRPTNLASSYMTNLAHRGRAAESGLYQSRDSSFLFQQNQESTRRHSVTSQTPQSISDTMQGGQRGLDASTHNDRQRASQVSTPTTSHSSTRYQTEERSPVPTVQDPNSLADNPALQSFSEGERALLKSLPMQLAKYLINLKGRGVSIRDGLRTISEALFDETDKEQGRGQEPGKHVLDRQDQQRRIWHSTIHYKSNGAPQPRNQESGVSSQVAGHLNPAHCQPNVAVTNNIDPVHPHHTSVTLANTGALSTEMTTPRRTQDTPVCNTAEHRQNQEAEHQAVDLVNKFRPFHNPPPRVTPLLEADDVRLSTEGQAIPCEGDEGVINSPELTDTATVIDLSTHTMGRKSNTHENFTFVDGDPYRSDHNFYHRAYSAGGYGPIRVSSLINLYSQALPPPTDEFTSPELTSTQLLIRNRLLERRLRIQSRSISTPDILHGYDIPKKRRKMFPEPIPGSNRGPVLKNEPQILEIIGGFRERNQETSSDVSMRPSAKRAGRDASPVQRLTDIGQTVINLARGDNEESAMESNVAAQYPKMKSSLQSRWVNQSVQTSIILTPDQRERNSTESISSSSDSVVTDKSATSQAIQEQMCVPSTTESPSVLPVDQPQLPIVSNAQIASTVKTSTPRAEFGSVSQTVPKRGENHGQPKGSNSCRKRKAEETPSIMLTACKFCPFEGRLSEVRTHANLVHFSKHCKKDSASKQPAVGTVGTAPPKPIIARDGGVNMSDQTIAVPVTVNSTNTHDDVAKRLVNSNVNSDVSGRILSPTAVHRQISEAFPVSASNRGVMTVASSPQPFQLEITRAVAPRTDRQFNETRVAEATSAPSQPAIGTGTTFAKFPPTISLLQTDDDDLVCKRCGQSCKNVKDLEIHVKLHHTNTKGVHMCFTCGRTCKSNHGLIKHIQKRHVDRERSINDYSCVHGECGLTFPSKTELTRHLRSHFKRKYICELCDAKFDYIGELRTHQSQHTDNLSHQCKECGLKFRTAGMLYRHELHKNPNHSSLGKR